MSPHPGVLTRSARALTALSTVWCLGCAAFEPLVDSVFRPDADSLCVSEIAGAATTIAASESADDGFCCGNGCGFCHSVSAQLVFLDAVEAVPPQAIRLTVGTLTSVTRAPVAPPPERRTL